MDNYNGNYNFSYMKTMTNLNRFLTTVVLTIVSCVMAWADVSQPNIYFDSSTKIYTITCPTEGATIYYTVDGTDPMTSTKRYKYTEPFKANRTLTIWAVAEKGGDVSVISTYWTSIESRFQKDNIYYQLVDNTLDDVIEVSPRQNGKYEGNVVIPSTVTHGGVTYTVVRIGNDAFYDAYGLTGVEMPNTITSIGRSAFYSCDRLTSIVLPSSVKTIETSAFNDCANLKNVSLNEGLEAIWNSAFCYCYALTSITLPSTLKTMDYEVFQGCRYLRSISIPDGVASIGYGLFDGCDRLEIVKLPASLDDIPNKLFYNCYALRSIIIPSTVKRIGSYAFYRCDALTSVTIPQGVGIIENNAFEGCINLLSVSIPEGITIVPYQAFKDNYSLTTVGLPSTLKTISKYSFHNCRSLTTVTIPENVSSIEKYAFTECEKLTSVYCLPMTPPQMSSDNDGNAFLDALQRATLYVKSEALASYTSSSRWDEFQTKKTIDNVLCEQPVFALADYMLTITTATAGATIYYTTDGTEPTTESILYTVPIPFMQNGTIRAMAVKDGMSNSVVSEFVKSNYVVPVPTVTMDENFRVKMTCEAPDLENFPETKIYYIVNGDSYNDYNLEREDWKLYDGEIQLTSPSYVHVHARRDKWNPSDQRNHDFYSPYYIAEPYLSYKQETQKVYIYSNYDSNVTYYYTLDGSEPTAESFVYNHEDSILVDHNVHVRCIGMRDGYFNSTIGEYRVSGLTTTFTVNDISYRRIDSNIADEVEITSHPNSNKKYSGDFVIPESVAHAGKQYKVTRIGYHAFYDCDGLTSVTIHPAIQSIGEGAFYDCANLGSVDIPESVETIENAAFQNCHALTQVTLHDGLKYIDRYAFSGCVRLTSIELPSTLTSIGEYAFSYLEALKSISIPDGVSSIANNAFQSCRSLVSVKLPAGLTTIRNSTFYSCTSLLSITIPSSVKTIENYAFQDCRSLTSLVIPQGVEEIMSAAFEGCYSLASVSLPESMTAIKDYTFRNCQALTTVSLPKSLKVIEQGAFNNCKALPSITIPENVQSIGKYAFTECSALKSVYAMPVTPPAMNKTDNDGNAFFGLTGNVVLYVKADAKDAYDSDSRWGEFDHVAVFDKVPSAQPIFVFDSHNYTLTISSPQDPSAAIYYTTDNTIPTEQSTLYTNPIPFMKNDTIKAVAISKGLGASLVSEFMKSDLTVPMPTAVLNDDDMVVTLNCDDPDIEGFPKTRFYYLINGNGYSVEKNNPNWQLLETNTIQLTSPGYLHVYADREGWQSSEQISCNYYSDYYLDFPVINWNSDTRTFTLGYYSPGYPSSIGDFYYTLDGTEPSKTNGTLYTGPFTIDRNLTLKVVVVADKHFNSEVRSYEVTGVETKFLVDGIYYRLKDKTIQNEVEVACVPSGVNNYSGSITINPMVSYNSQDYVVVGVYEYAFRGSSINAISLPDGLQYIGKEAFYDCQSLAEIDIPSTVAEVGNSAFYSCYALKKVTLREGLKTIRERAFGYCTQLNGLTLPNTLTAIERSAFYGCSGLTAITWPASISTIEEDMFSGCEKLVNVSLPATLTTMKSSAFAGCKSLQAIALPESLTYIGSSAFSTCNSLSSVVIPNGVVKIEDYTFYVCSSLVSISLPDHLKTIGSRAFYDCKSLASITLPATLTNIGYYAFNSCYSLASIYAQPTTPPALEDGAGLGAFYEQATLFVQPAAKSAYSVAPYWSQFKTIREFTKLAAEQPAFVYQDYKLTLSTITDGGVIYYTRDGSEPTTQSLRYTEPLIFAQNDTVKAITVAEGLENSLVAEFRKNDFTVAQPQSVLDEETYQVTITCETPEAEGIPETRIWYATRQSYYGPEASKYKLYDGEPIQLTEPSYVHLYAERDGWKTSDWRYDDFYSNYRLDAPSINYDYSTYTITMVQNNADSIMYTLDGSEPSKSNGMKYDGPIVMKRDLIVKAVAVKEKHFNSEVKSYSVTGVDSRFMANGVYYRLVDNTTEDVVEVTSGSTVTGHVTIPDKVTHPDGTICTVVRVGKDAFAHNSDITGITLPSTVTSIGNSAFYNSNNLVDIDWPEGLTEIGKAAFYCTAISTVVIPEGVKSISEEAFYGCNKLTSLIIPSGVTEIGNRAFYGCGSLTSLNLPEGVISIGSYAFYNIGVINVSLPSTIREIGDDAFAFCKNLATIVIPDGVTTVRGYTFSGCSALKSVGLPSTLTTIESYAFYNCEALESIVLPESVASIATGAFSGDGNLRHIYAQPLTHPTVDVDSPPFPAYVVSNATLYVKEQALQDYSQAGHWGSFNISTFVNLPCEQPVFVYDNYMLTMTSQTPGVSIYFTLDGTEPTTSSMLYKEPIAIAKNDTIKAMAIGENWGRSLTSEWKKNDLKVASPLATIDNDFTVTITCEEPIVEGLPATRIYYSLNRSSWSGGTEEDWKLYTEPLKLTIANYLHVRAERDGWINSGQSDFNYYTDYYLEKPSISPYYSSISYMPADTTITLSHSLDDVQLYYTLDGSDPNVNGVLYTAPIKPQHNVNVVVIAKREGAINSDPEQREFKWFTIPTPVITIEHLAAVMKVEKPEYARIYYTLDNSTPTEESPLYSGPVALNKDCKIKAIAIADNWNTSSVGSFNSSTGFVKKDYTVQKPAFNAKQVVSGVMVENADSVLTITTATEGATIYYTLDGSTPTVNSLKYENGIKMTENCTVKAFAMKEDMFDSETIEAEVDWLKVKQPHIQFNGKYVEMWDDTEDAVIYYTIDGTNPDTKSKAYLKPFALDAEETSVRAIAVKENWNNSEISRLTYNPGKNYCEAPGITRVAGANKVQMSTRTAGAKIYYTTDGLNPTVNSTLYTTEVVVTENCTLKAMAVDSLLYDSEVTSFNVDWFKADQPIVTVDGIYVTITSPIENSKIYYTLDGSEPTTASTLYEGTLTMKGSCTIKAIAAFDNYNNSSVAVFNYYSSEYTCGLPVFSREGNTVSIASAPAEGTTIYYTTDGTTPTTASSVFTEPIEVSQNITIKAMAVNAKLFTSEVSEYEVNWFKVEMPVIAFDGIFATMTCQTPNSRIYYTLDGSSPTAESFLFTEAITMPGSCTVKAIATRDNFNNSAVTAISFDRASNTVSTPQFTRNGNTVSVKVTQTEGTTIYYTLDGSAPTTESTIYSSPVQLIENGTMKAMAVNPRLFASEVSAYEVDWFKVTTPVIQQEGKSFSITCSTPDAAIYYSLDGDPLDGGILYTAPVGLVDNRVVRAVATKKNFHDSEMATLMPDLFVCDVPTFNYNGRYLQIQTGEDMTIHYTTDGSKPTEESDICNGQVEIANLCTVRAIATRRDFRDSPEASFTVNYLYDGEEASLDEAGKLEDVFQWIGGTGTVEELTVNGKLNAKDLNFIRSISTLKHLDLSAATYEGDNLPDEAFANLQLISFSSPKQLSSVGSHLFKGCDQLAAVVWNANVVIPENVISDIKNPNFLLYVNSLIYTPSSYKGNLISGGQATSITLSDSETGNNFYCPQRFYTQRISYTHTYSQTTESGTTRGWETLALPFDVETITHEKRGALAPFAKGEDITKFKPFWLYELKETGFDRSGEIKAYTPYILSMPNNPDYADDYILAGNVTFTANNIYIETDTAKVTMKGSVRFTPTMLRQEKASEVLAINLTDCTINGTFYASGSAFIADMRAVRPFEAYALVNANSAPQIYEVGEFLWGTLSDIRSSEMKQLEAIGQKRGIYDLSGRRLSKDSSILEKKNLQHQRVYIINGKKTMVK